MGPTVMLRDRLEVEEEEETLCAGLQGKGVLRRGESKTENLKSVLPTYNSRSHDETGGS